MRPRRLLPLFVCALVGCGVLTGPDDASLVGTWAQAPATFSFDSATYGNSLELKGDGTFTQVMRMTEPSGGARGYTASEGTFVVLRDSLFASAKIMRSWDRRFNGGVVIVSPANGYSPFGGGARIAFRNDSLVLTYLGFHPDLPLETVEVYSRVQ